MIFTDAELDYLASQRLGRLATAQPDGTLQVNPVGFRCDPDTGTIAIVGYRMAASRKFRNVAANGRAAFVVDDIPSVQPFRVRSLEIRGRAEAIAAPAGSDGTDSAGNTDGAMIIVHPKRIITLGIEDPDQEPHLLAPRSRDVGSASARRR